VVSLLLACTSPEPPLEAAPISWTAEPVVDLVLAQDLVPSHGAGASSVVCTARDDATERHHAAGISTIRLFGLLAETSYDCEVTSTDGVASIAFETGPLPDWLPSWHLAEAGGDRTSYTILNHGTDLTEARETKILLVDPQGRLRWYFDVPYNAPDLDVSYLGGGQILYGGGYTAPPTVIDLAGEQRLTAVEPDIYHHHAEQLDDGSFVTLTLDANSDGVISWTGMEIEILDPAMRSTVWSWRTQRGVDESWLEVPPAPSDPYHMNSVAVLEDAVYASLRDDSAIVKLDRVTGDREWTLGPSGDFALVDASGAPAPPAAWFYGAHAPEHDGDRILLHDNGYLRPGSRTTRIVEMAIDEGARTAEVLWAYTEPGWYEPIWGDVDWLANGNVLYTRAHCAKCVPEDPSTTQIAELDPDALTVVWRLVFEDPHDAGYRAERIDGCAIFGNERYCAAL